MNVALYRPDELDDIPWPNTPEAKQVRGWVEPLMRGKTSAFIDNVDTDLHVAVCDQWVLPFSVGCRGGTQSSYVCSPYAHYISYALDETRFIDPVSRFVSHVLAYPVGALCRWGELDKVVLVNNWLLSTNLYPQLPAEVAAAVATALLAAYPDHVIAFRSVDLACRRPLSETLSEAGARLVFSRRVHVVTDSDKPWTRSDVKKDRKLMRRSRYVKVPGEEFRDEDFARAAHLYTQLYVDKYSHYNPKFTPALVRSAWEAGVWNLTGLAYEGRLDGVIGTYTFGGVLTTPLLGYDTDLPAKLGLYRLLCQAILEEATEKGVTANRSAGAAVFKQNRGADSFLEYNAVFDSHLPVRRRVPWRLIQAMLDWAVVPMILRRNL